MKSLTAIALVLVLGVVVLGITPSLKVPEISGSVRAQDLSHTIYLPLVMKDYGNVRLESHRAFYYTWSDPYGYEAECLVVVGELKNHSDEIIYEPGPLVVNFRKADGEVVVTTDNDWPFAHTLAPGDVTAFRCQICDPPTCPSCPIAPAPSEWSYYTLNLSFDETSIGPANLAVNALSFEQTDDGLTVEVEITNQETERVCVLTTWITLYDEDGNVLNADYSLPPPPSACLDPGETVYTSVGVRGPVSGYTDYLLGAYAHGP